MTERPTVPPSATSRLRGLVEAELERRNITAAEAAREARLPAGVFHSLTGRGHRPTLERAEELCRALGIRMTIGGTSREVGSEPVDKNEQGLIRSGITPRTTTVEKSATDRLRALIEAELARQGLSHARAVREAQLPGSVFQSLLRLGKQPSIDRADELCRALDTTMTIGTDDAQGDAKPDERATD